MAAARISAVPLGARSAVQPLNSTQPRRPLRLNRSFAGWIAARQGPSDHSRPRNPESREPSQGSRKPLGGSDNRLRDVDEGHVTRGASAEDSHVRRRRATNSGSGEGPVGSNEARIHFDLSTAPKGQAFQPSGDLPVSELPGILAHDARRSSEDAGLRSPHPELVDGSRTEGEGSSSADDAASDPEDLLRTLDFMVSWQKALSRRQQEGKNNWKKGRGHPKTPLPSSRKLPLSLKRFVAEAEAWGSSHPDMTASGAAWLMNQCWEHPHRLKGGGLKPSRSLVVEDFLEVWNAVTPGHNPTVVEGLLGFAIMRGVTLDAAAGAAYIRALAVTGNTGALGSVDSALQGAGVTLDLGMWNAMIDDCSRAGFLTMALQVPRRMVSAGVAPTGETVVSLMRACTTEGLLSEAIELFTSAHTCGISLGVAAYTSFFHCCNQLGRRANLRELGHSFTPDQACLEEMVRLLVRQEDYAQAWEVFDRQRGLLLVPNVQTYGIMIRLSWRQGKGPTAEDLFSEVQQRESARNSHPACAAMIEGSLGEENLERSLELLGQMVFSGMKPDFEELFALLRFFVQSKQFRHAFAVLHYTRKNGPGVHLRLFTFLLMEASFARREEKSWLSLLLKVPRHPVKALLHHLGAKARGHKVHHVRRELEKHMQEGLQQEPGGSGADEKGQRGLTAALIHFLCAESMYATAVELWEIACAMPMFQGRVLVGPTQWLCGSTCQVVLSGFSAESSRLVMMWALQELRVSYLKESVLPEEVRLIADQEDSVGDSSGAQAGVLSVLQDMGMRHLLVGAGKVMVQGSDLESWILDPASGSCSSRLTDSNHGLGSFFCINRRRAEDRVHPPLTKPETPEQLVSALWDSDA